MSLDQDLNNLSQRLGRIVARFDERTRRLVRSAEYRSRGGLLRAVAADLRDLLVRDVTPEGLLGLVQRDARDTVRFFTGHIDFATVGRMPWFRRYPAITWQIFLSMAYRLSPPRRIAFVAACFAFLIGLARLLIMPAASSDTVPGLLPPGAGWWLVSTALFALLLLMELRDKLDLKGDLEIARDIQFGLVPARPVELNGYALHHAMRPANTVGGDYYDVIALGPDRLAVVMADVAGKGMPAALLMALLQGSLRTLITAGFSGEQLISRLNDYLCDSIPSNRIVTLFYGELDTTSGTLLYVNAGHNAPILAKPAGPLKRLDSTAIVLGFVKDCRFETATVELEAGCRLVLYTDGIVEAFNEAGQEYGEPRLESFLAAREDLHGQSLIDALMQDVLSFCAGFRPADDMTILVVDSARGAA